MNNLGLLMIITAERCAGRAVCWTNAAATAAAAAAAATTLAEQSKIHITLEE